MNKSIYDLKLGESSTDEIADCAIKRVPGGWIYRFWDIRNDDVQQGHGVFVPFSDEFLEKKKG